MRLVNPKKPTKGTLVIEKFLSENQLEHFPDIKKHDPKIWLASLETLLKKEATTPRRPNFSELEKLRKAARASIPNLNDLKIIDEEESSIVEELECYQDDIECLFDICREMLKRIPRKTQLRQYILENISINSVWNRCSPHAQWPEIIEDLEDIILLIQRDFAYIKAQCISSTVLQHHTTNLSINKKTENFFIELEKIAEEESKKESEEEKNYEMEVEKEFETSKKEFIEVWIKSFVSSVINCCKQNKMKTLYVFHLDNELDLNTIKPEWKEYGITFKKHEEMMQRSDSILLKKGIVIKNMTVDATKYFSWLNETKQANNQETRAKYAQFLAENEIKN